jgi:Ca2+-binding EF-hand superfamily protein
LQEFKAAFSDIGYSEIEVEMLFEGLDVNRNAVINYTEFLAAALDLDVDADDHRLAEAFDALDCDDTGYISRENLIKFLGHKYSHDQILSMIHEVDTRGDGKVSYEEFKCALNSKHISYDTQNRSTRRRPPRFFDIARSRFSLNKNKPMKPCC